MGQDDGECSSVEPGMSHCCHLGSPGVDGGLVLALFGSQVCSGSTYGAEHMDAQSLAQRGPSQILPYY